MNDFIDKINELWWASGSAVVAFLNLSFVYIEKLSFSEEKFLGNCLLAKSQIKSKKVESLKDFIKKTKNNFNDVQGFLAIQEQETDKNIYMLLINDFERYDGYYQEADKIRKTIKFIKTSFMIFIGIAALLLLLGFLFPQLRLSLFILSAAIIILTVIFLFVGRNLQSRIDNLLNDLV